MTLAMLAPLAALFVNPLHLPAGARLWLFLPLALSISLVYQATRAESASELPRRTARTFLNLVVGMVVIAVGFYLVHQAALRWW